MMAMVTLHTETVMVGVALAATAMVLVVRVTMMRMAAVSTMSRTMPTTKNMQW